ncbi:MAG: hypothetical protein Q9208_003998 [Pyrenodesmia sp. 3 TL-2023]
MSPTFCASPPQLSEKIGPEIRPQVIIGNDFKLAAILRAFKADDFRKFSSAPVLYNGMPIPVTLGLSIANNSQQLPLLITAPPDDSASSLLTAALKLVLSDIPTFIAFAGEGRFTTESYPSLPLDPTFDIATGLHTFVTSKLMQMNDYYAVPMDVVSEEIANKTAAGDEDAVYHWSPNTQRLYELRAKGDPVIDTVTLYGEHLRDDNWVDLQLLFDGSYNCTKAGHAGRAIVYLPNNVTDVSCVSQLPMYLPKNSPCPTRILVDGKCPFGYLG